MSPLEIGIIGMGNVGSGVAKILTNQSEMLTRRAGRPINIRKATVRDLGRDRGISLPDGVLTVSIDEVIKDPEISLVVQLIGGIEPARDIMLRCLQAGKNVVTANKALLCEHSSEIFATAKANNCCVAYEAAVAGGIPIIDVVGKSLASNQLLSIEAILNGTSNFILTEMFNRNASYDEILHEAQQLGYAEADPTFDIDGTDAAQKLVLLTQLAWGTTVSLADFPRQGIDTLELADLKYARELGYKVKLLATSRMVDDQLEMHVQPTLIKTARPLANIDGAFNAVSLLGDAVGRTWYCGPGAGQMPTASAVASDIIDMALGRTQITFPKLEIWGENGADVVPKNEITSRFYLRFQVEDRPHVFADIADILGQHEISLASIIQHEAPELDVTGEGEYPVVPLVVMTHRTQLGKLLAADEALSKLDALREPRVRLLVADQ
ncbi:MAG: homoserine dehydrogenase [Planctomycetaceae bacterium]|jgi:homoserine dehydrogenase|nr:homoserine dehydrogenase [Planctomycetaceae bacterium]